MMISIHPNRWISGGMGLTKFREWMVTNPKWDYVYRFSNEKIFDNTQIAGNVQIVRLDKNYNDSNLLTVEEQYVKNICYNRREFDIIPRDFLGLNIIRKAIGVPKFKPLEIFLLLSLFYFSLYQSFIDRN